LKFANLNLRSRNTGRENEYRELPSHRSTAQERNINSMLKRQMLLIN